MATTMLEPLPKHHTFTVMTFSNPKPLRVCFSYAAYAKNLMLHLYSENIPVEAGLSEAEFSAVESSFNFIFPPDLRSILREGLPVGPGFPNWRCSSKQQLEIITSLPILGICKEVSRNGFWFESWGARPDDCDCAEKMARRLLRKSPILVPIYRHFYIPSTPCMAGNPVFYVHGGDVKLWSNDIAGFFTQVEFRMNGGDEILRKPRVSDLLSAPAWAATEARGIEFWTEMAKKGKNAAAREGTRGWWSGELGGCLEEVCWRLRDGGWKEEDVREMMMMDGCDDEDDKSCDEPLNKERVRWRVRVLSARLLRAGWSTEDVVESLGSTEDCHEDGDSCFDLHYRNSDNRNHNNNKNNSNSNSPFMNLQCVRV
ncbi:hypothetical protein BUALT_Bualt11G0064100 [Buddleja alternifolia]|uniref:F-box protein n=1 Tax=Buddleja alternifolia TaxID=168488 RepID=A0AAV6WTT3_9LAMI|nr:hypothetical protein BUALT_Bualt11G0064100 [Buddleja alternifolia]